MLLQYLQQLRVHSQVHLGDIDGYAYRHYRYKRYRYLSTNPFNKKEYTKENPSTGETQ